MIDFATAASRFGLGARPDGIRPTDVRAALRAQLDRFEARPAFIAAAPTRATVAGALADYLEVTRAYRQQVGTAGEGTANAKVMRAETQAMDASGAPTSETVQQALRASRKYAGQVARDQYIALVGARMNAALTTEAPLVERMVHFWANHFAISIDKLPVIGLGGLLEVEAIRPHVLGKFADMLLAVERHPAMLLYLDQAQSVGPHSRVGAASAARGRRQVGLNENFAREIMELHTLGVRTGYSQADVTELARAMTGWTTAGITRGPMVRALGVGRTPGEFVFAPAIHQPGERQIMGRRSAAGGADQAERIMRDLAAHPATATHIATKLARHFCGRCAAQVARRPARRVLHGDRRRLACAIPRTDRSTRARATPARQV